MYKNVIKRILDIVISLVALIVLMPVMLLEALLIKVFLGGPVLFKQKRPGKDGKIFVLYKFRTMTNEKDSHGNLLPDEQRHTKLGNILRKTSIDELPELVNILKGDMSLIGPRPLLVEYLPLYNDRQKRRHEVRPGLTGYAQIKVDNIDTTWEEKFERDIYYVDNISFGLDLKIFFATFFALIGRAACNTTIDEFKGNVKEDGEE